MVTQKSTFFPTEKYWRNNPHSENFRFKRQRFPLGGFSLILSGNAAFSQLYNIAAVKSNQIKIKSKVVFELKGKPKCFVISHWKTEIDVSLKTNIFGGGGKKAFSSFL